MSLYFWRLPFDRYYNFSSVPLSEGASCRLSLTSCPAATPPYNKSILRSSILRSSNPPPKSQSQSRTNCPHANCGKQKRTNEEEEEEAPRSDHQQLQRLQVAAATATCNMPLTPQTETHAPLWKKRKKKNSHKQINTWLDCGYQKPRLWPQSHGYRSRLAARRVALLWMRRLQLQLQQQIKLSLIYARA